MQEASRAGGLDVSDTIVAKSDQLNADDLVGGPITVKVLGVSRTDVKEQPVLVRIAGGHMPFRPCKSMRRILVAAWGPDAAKWHGRWMRLYRDESVRWAGAEVGGVRIAALSHIDERGLSLSLAVSKGKKALHRIAYLQPGDQQQAGAPTADLDALLADAELTRADVDRWLAAEGKPSLASAPDKVPVLAAWLAADAARLEAIRALIPTVGREPGEDQE